MHYYSPIYRANTNDGLNFVRYKYSIMANRKNIQENIQRVTGKITELNADLRSRKELSVLDIDLLRKHVIDLYDEVNHLRLVMKESMDHGPWTMEERKAEPAAEAESEVEDEENGGQGDNNRVRHTERSRSKTDNHETSGDEGKRNVEEMRSENDEDATKVRHLSEEPVLSLSKERTTDPESEVNLEALTKAENQVESEAEVEAMVEAIVEEDLPNEETQNPEPITQNPEPITQNPEIKLAAAEAKAEADAIKAAQNPEEANDLAFKFSNTPIHDLKKAISIAEKFEFINSLFGGNVEKYAYSIHHLNNLNNGDEAFTYLHDLRIEWKWDDEDKNFQKLANLIRRRFLG